MSNIDSLDFQIPGTDVIHARSESESRDAANTTLASGADMTEMDGENRCDDQDFVEGERSLDTMYTSP